MTIYTARKYQSTSPEKSAQINSWLDTNAGITTTFAVGVLAMAWAAIFVPYQVNKDVVAVVSTSMSGE